MSQCTRATRDLDQDGENIDCRLVRNTQIIYSKIDDDEYKSLFCGCLDGVRATCASSGARRGSPDDSRSSPVQSSTGVFAG
jgi:hypothetical protein